MLSDFDRANQKKDNNLEYLSLEVVSNQDQTICN